MNVLKLTNDELEELSYLLSNVSYNLNLNDYDSIIDKINEIDEIKKKQIK
jgi:hypothetical protein